MRRDSTRQEWSAVPQLGPRTEQLRSINEGVSWPACQLPEMLARLTLSSTAAERSQTRLCKISTTPRRLLSDLLGVLRQICVFPQSVRQIFNIHFSSPRLFAPVTKILLLQFILPAARRNVVWPPIFQVRVNRTFGMIRRILDTFDDPGLQRLIRLSQLLDARIRCILDRRKSLPISRLPSAVGANLPRISSQFVRLRFFIAKSSIHHHILLNCHSRFLDATIPLNVFGIQK